MLKSKYIWETKATGIVANDQILKTLLKNRDIHDPEAFFSMGEESLHDPYLINDMAKAEKRIIKAVSGGEKIIIYGDYDCDGICSIAVLYRTLKKLGADVSYDLPNRFLDGYGLNMRAVEGIIEEGYQLVITVDNGVSCFEEVKALSQAGIDTIITDHHEIPEQRPHAYAICHTHLSPDYPFKDIAGVMVAFKLAQALIGDDAKAYYDLAMIGSVADLMPLKDENQAIVNLGLERMKKTENPGLQKLIEFSNLDIINVTAISFKIAPKINSSGRLGKAMDAVRLLVTDDAREINDLILQIERNHSSRKKLTEEAFRQCEELVNPNDRVIVIYSDKLHEGVIGICAQKIVEKYQKSTLVITLDYEGLGKGSMRSFGDENILDLLHQNADRLIRYGGHSQAAGLQVDLSQIEALKSGLNAVAAKGKAPVLMVDMELDLCQIELDTIQEIQDRSFFTASYLFKDLVVSRKQILAQKHTKLVLDCHGLKFDALHFNSLSYHHSLENGDHINLVAGLNVNHYRNRAKIQLMIKDVECQAFQVLDLRATHQVEDDRKWIEQPYLEIDDDLLMNTNLKSYLKTQKDIGTILITPKKSHLNLNKIVQKRELGKIYAMLKEIKEFNRDMLLRRMEYDPKILSLAIQIFMELNLIELDDDVYRVDEQPLKTDLEKSKTYKDMEIAKKMIDFVYLDYLSHIRTYFRKLMEESS